MSTGRSITSKKERAEWARLREELIRLREKRGYSQRAVAELLDVTQASISQIENEDELIPRAATQDRIKKLVAAWTEEESGGAMEQHDYICPNCFHKVPGPDQQAQFCFRCGKQFDLKCACGELNPGSSAFCGKCGRALLPSKDYIPAPDDPADEALRKLLVWKFQEWLDQSNTISSVEKFLKVIERRDESS